MAVCGLRTLLLILCILELIITLQRQVFDFLGFMWLPIIANFLNILLIIFGSFGAVQYITKYLIAYSVWSFMWLIWNIFLMCYYLNVGTLNRESSLLSLGTGSVSWWEGNGWGCQSVWGEVDGPGIWRPTRVDGCFLKWYLVELGQSAVGALFATMAMPLAILLTFKSCKKRKPKADKGTLSRRRPVYTIELSSAETNINESSIKPMTPRRVKRRSGSRGNGSSVRRSRRSYRNAGYIASNASLPREARSTSRPTSAHSSYSNFHGARSVSCHIPQNETLPKPEMYEPPPPVESVPIVTNRYNTVGRSSMKSGGYDVVGPYNEPNPHPPRLYEQNIQPYDNMERGYEMASNYENRLDNVTPCESPSYVYGGGGGAAYGEGGWPPPPAPPYSARATPQAPGPPAYHPTNDIYDMAP